MSKVRKTAFFMKIDPAPFSDFGAAEGGTVIKKKKVAAEGCKITKENSLPPPKAGE